LACHWPPPLNLANRNVVVDLEGLFCVAVIKSLAWREGHLCLLPEETTHRLVVWRFRSLHRATTSPLLPPHSPSPVTTTAKTEKKKECSGGAPRNHRSFKRRTAPRSSHRIPPAARCRCLWGQRWWASPGGVSRRCGRFCPASLVVRPHDRNLTGKGCLSCAFYRTHSKDVGVLLLRSSTAAGACSSIEFERDERGERERPAVGRGERGGVGGGGCGSRGDGGGSATGGGDGEGGCWGHGARGATGSERREGLGFPNLYVVHPFSAVRS
jgi:hypothetical protein